MEKINAGMQNGESGKRNGVTQNGEMEKLNGERGKS